MNTMAISFDWLLTIPGLLISSGVLLLIIALVIFIVTTVKSKKEEKGGVSAPVVEQNSAPVVDMATPSVDAVSNSEEKEIASTTVSIFPTVTDIPVISNGETTQENPVNVIPITPMEEPQVAEQTVEVAPVIDETPVQPIVEEAAPIYGGADITVPPVVEEHRPIYGGADPMEATIKMDPIVEPTPVVPEINPIVEEATLTDVQDEVVEEKHDTAILDDTTTDYTVDTPTPVVESVEEVPVETEEKIEQL